MPTSGQMRVDRRLGDGGTQDGTVVLAVSGEVDADNCRDFHSALIDGAGPAQAVVVDMSELGFLDSSGITQLLRFKTELDQTGRAVTIENPSPPVRRVLEITGLLDHFGLGA